MTVHSQHRSSTDRDDSKRLHEERVKLHFPWSISPFEKETSPSKAEIDDEKEDLQDEKKTLVAPECQHELKTKTAGEVPWIDLILDIAMTTALANLTNNTTISRGKDVLGYLCFWGLTWWIWASIVAYNVRFRQADLIHRWAVIFQLAIFGALAAFTRDFDITNDISSGEDPNQVRANQIQLQLGAATTAGIEAQKAQRDRLPKLNFRGIAITMACSRFLLMTQYVVVYIYASRQRINPNRFVTAILIHIISLALSAVAFFASFIILGKDPTPADNIAKIPLWYGALTLELLAHFIPPVFKLNGHVHYSARGLYSRARTLFIIVLGQGLDKLTGTFSFVVGPTGLGGYSVASLISTVVVLIAQFHLSFGSAELSRKTSCLRSLVWFFGQFVYTSAVIVLVLATANLLISSSFSVVVGHAISGVAVAIRLVTGAFPRMPNVSDIPANDTKSLLSNGIAPEDVMKVVYDAESAHSLQERVSALLKLSLHIVFTVAEDFNIQPKPSEPLYWDLRKAMNKTNSLNQSSYNSINEEFARAHYASVIWFPAAGGATLIFVALFRYIKQAPRDRWDWANIGVIGGAGMAYALLSILDIGSNKPIANLDESYNIVINSPIFTFAYSGWMLLSFVILNIVLLIALGLQDYFARRSKGGNPKTRNSTTHEPVDKAHHLREYTQGSLSQQPVSDYMQHASDDSLSCSYRNLRRESPEPFSDGSFSGSYHNLRWESPDPSIDPFLSSARQ